MTTVWTPVDNAIVGFMILGLLLYGRGTYDQVNHTYDYLLGDETQPTFGSWDNISSGGGTWNGVAQP